LSIAFYFLATALIKIIFLLNRQTTL